MYKDYGQIFATDNLGIGGRIESGWFDDSEEVWDMLLKVMTDQNIDLYMYTRDKELVEDSIGTMLMNVPANAGQYQRVMTGQRPGYSFKIVGVNNSGMVINGLKVRLQVAGQ